MSAEADDLGRRYAAALHQAAGEPGERSLSAAYELGRDAVRSGLSVLDLAAIHNDAVAAEVRAAPDTPAAERTTDAAGAFFLESLSAYEMLQRVLRETRERARLEQRQTALLRRLSGFLGDASLAADANASVHEVLQLVAEHALDFVDAAACRACLGPTDSDPSVLEAVASTGTAELPDAATLQRLAELHDELGPTGPIRLTPGEVVQRVPGGEVAWLAAPLTALDGRQVGFVHLFGVGDASFSDVDEAVVAQLAHMASATFERMQLYRR